LSLAAIPSPSLPPTLPAPQVGDYVDIVANSYQQKGMPHKFYHGRTGVVYNVTRRALGVEVNKQVRNRVLRKRINVRVEHVRPSKCRLDFLARVKKNEEVKRAAKTAGTKAPIEAIKRFPTAPKPGYVVPAESAHGLPVVIAPLPFDEML
jgi:large subunit ribosomal protein L21e